MAVDRMTFSRDRLRKLLDNQESLEGMRAAFGTILERQEETARDIPDLEERRSRLRRMKEESVGNRALFEKAVDNLRANGVRVEFADGPGQVTDILVKEIGEERLVVKSKSNISKELEIARSLGERGIEVIETDMGDRIIQICGDDPVHPTGPAAHLDRYQIAEILSKHFGRNIPPSPEELTEVVRDELDGYFKRARIAVTGANAIAASEGSIVLVHNEGNITRCSQSPSKHIILTTPEKVVPDLEEAVNLIKVQTYFSTGQVTSAHIDIISGPSYTADIEKKLFKGMHGPSDIVVIFADNGRSGLKENELLRCISCGSCLLRCPVYDQIGPNFGSKGHLGGIGVALSAGLESVERADEIGLFLCTSCGSCEEGCPVSIDIRPYLYDHRGLAGSHRLLSEDHQVVLSSIRNYDNPWMQPRSARARWSRGLDLPKEGEVLYFPGCSQSLMHPETAVKAVGLLGEAGLDPAYLGAEEPCCGSIARKLGDSEMFERQMVSIFDAFERAGAKTVIASCPGCLLSLRMGAEMLKRDGIEFRHITEVLAESLPELPDCESDSIRLAYHDPCELGRGLGVFDPPRRLLEEAGGIDLVELDNLREKSACCGAGAGVRSGFPELASAIAARRLEEARDKDVRHLVTACPWCLENLSQAAKGGDIQVLDLLEFLWERRLSRAR
ncbi:MAG TPA: hypothetical protein ENN25_02845 [Euryarchaeota archaeon]|nr:hypothetical protein [Euryarchaeota archaeon]